MELTFQKSSASDSTGGDNQEMQQNGLLQLTECRFECVLECKARAIPFAVFLIIGANTAEYLDVSEAATVFDGFPQLAMKRF